MLVCLFFPCLFITLSIALGLANSNAVFLHSDSTPEITENNILKCEDHSLKKENSGGAGDGMV